MTPIWGIPPRSRNATRSCSCGVSCAARWLESEVAVFAKPGHGLAKRGSDGRGREPELAAGLLIGAIFPARQQPDRVLIEARVFVGEESGLEEIFGHRDREHEHCRNAQARAWTSGVLGEPVEDLVERRDLAREQVA